MRTLQPLLLLLSSAAGAQSLPTIEPPTFPTPSACSAGIACAEMNLRIEAVSSVVLTVPDIDFGTVEVGVGSQGASFAIDLTAVENASLKVSMDAGLHSAIDGASGSLRRFMSAGSTGPVVGYDVVYADATRRNDTAEFPTANWGTDPDAVGVAPFNGASGIAPVSSRAIGPLTGSSSYRLPGFVRVEGPPRTGIYTDTITVFVDLAD